jgi:DNA-binding SARP family transcriptional activator
VLAVLAGRVGRTVAVSEIVGGVWGFEPPRTAEKTLQSHVIAFAPDALRRGWRRGEGVLLTDSAGYRLAVPSDAVDAACFERLVKQARQERVVDTAGAAVIYRQALALWRGPAYSGLDDVQGLQAEATRLEEFRLVCVEECLATELDAGRADELIPEIQAAVARMRCANGCGSAAAGAVPGWPASRCACGVPAGPSTASRGARRGARPATAGAGGTNPPVGIEPTTDRLGNRP